MITPPSLNIISGGLKQHDHHCHLIVLWCDKPECGCQTEEPQDARDLAFCALEFEPHSMASATSCWHSLVDIMLCSVDICIRGGARVGEASGEINSVSNGERALSAVTTSLIRGRTTGSSCRHIEAIATD